MNPYSKSEGVTNMHIKEAAKKLNTTARTIRLYEEKGLISLKKIKKMIIESLPKATYIG